MKWYVKAAVQKVVSLLPASHKINRWMQTLNGNECLDKRRCHRKWTQMIKMLEIVASHNGSVRSGTALEIGAGRHLVPAFALRSAGVDSVITYDLQFLTSYEMCLDVIKTLMQLHDSGRIEISAEVASNMDRVMHPDFARPGTQQDTVELLASFGIDYRVGDVFSVPENDFDLFFSVSTLEHIPADGLRRLFQFFHDKSQAGSFMAHGIDMKDHFSQDDRSITKYNFLKYSDGIWRIVNCALNYQNRLRASEYIKLASAAGWSFAGAEERRKDADTLGQVRLAKKFRSGYEQSDLEINAINAVWRRTEGAA